MKNPRNFNITEKKKKKPAKEEEEEVTKAKPAKTEEPSTFVSLETPRLCFFFII